jgi:hypothetical protein
MGLKQVNSLYFDSLITNTLGFALVYGQKHLKNI